MDRIIRETTDKYLKKLDSNREYYTPAQLLEAGLPDYLVQRIRLELIRNLQDSVRPPESDWANMSAGSVTHALDQFLQAIREEVRLPTSYAGSVLESALSDILELLVTPRAFLPDYLFGSEQTLDLDRVHERCEWIVVYRYFSGAIPRFMEKKGRDKLTREQADRIIERLDERVTAPYTSLNWGQLFEPWFTLMGDSVDPSLFAAFFRDKGKPGVARLFDAEQVPINRTRLIEILSRPQLDDDDDDDDLSEITAFNTLEGRVAKTEVSGSTNRDRKKQVSNPEVTAFGSSTSDDEQADAMPALKTGSAAKEESPVYIRKGGESKSEMPEQGTDRADSGHKQKDFSGEIGIKKKTGAKSDEDSDEDNLLGRFRTANYDERDEQPLHSRLRKETPDDEESRPLYSRITSDPKSETSNEIPIWQRFTEVRPDTSEEEKTETIRERIAASLRASEESSEEVFRSDSDFNEAPDAVFESEPDFNANKLSEPLEIRTHVKDMEQQFVDEIFGGDENAYLDALLEIERLKDWKQAGKYISHEIFDRNLIDIYSDTAIDFTDRMQTYFLERSM